MRIAILGWGSLIWEPGDLPLQTDWIMGGPQLPLEFSRASTSRDGALTLVIDPKNGTMVQTRYAISERSVLPEAIEDLRKREKTASDSIGYVNLTEGSKRCNFHPEVGDVISRWAEDNNIDAVIWTDLPSNFSEKIGADFSVPKAIEYLKTLSQDGATKARRYIREAPNEVDTLLRRMVRDDPWFNDL